MTDDEIIQSILKGGRDHQMALEYIYNKKSNKERITRALVKMGIDHDEADDIFHDGIITFDKCVLSGKFRGESSVDTYLYSICKFLCLNLWRKKKKLIYMDDVTSVAHFHSNFVSDSIIDEFLKKEQKTIIGILLDEVGETCKNILSLWQLSYSMEEICNMIGLTSPQMAKKKRFMCHKKLMLLLENKFYYQHLIEIKPEVIRAAV